ncbi:MAG: hypothetical protein GC186_20060 [Rhodobacteraceae bacterium]|nr:hypothetical protein [Paracoccaceae bacterium]
MPAKPRPARPRVSDGSEVLAFVCRCVLGLVAEMLPSDADLIRRIDIGEENRAALCDALQSHCGYCCKHGFEDCSRTPVGCVCPAEATGGAKEKSSADGNLADKKAAV